MFGNLKDFISVVQDGITSNNNLRQTLQEVQKVKYIFRERSKPIHENKVNYGAGSKLLDKYQQEWAEMHENADKNAKAAEEVDKIILEVHENAKSKLIHANDLAQSLTSLSKLTMAVEECIDTLKDVETLIKVVEEELLDLENLSERSTMAKNKLDYHCHLSVYKERKLAELDKVRGQLSKESAQRSSNCERKQLTNVQAQRSASSAAFNNDISQYLATGNLPSSSTTNTQKLTLDQVQLDEDDGDLDKFLNS